MRQKIWRWAVIIFSSYLIYAFPVSAVGVPANANNQVKTIDRIVVFVNKSVITSNQIDNQLHQVLFNLAQKKIPVPNTTDLRHQVIEQLILQQIELDLAAKAGIKTTDLEVTEAIDNIIKQQNTTLSKLKGDLSKEGITLAEFRKQVQQQITMEKLRQREVNSRAVVSDDEVNRVLSSVAYQHKIDYDLSDIIVSIPEGANETIIKQKEDLANLAYNALKSGTPFTQVAIKYSTGPNALSGGELGVKSSSALPPIIAQNLATLKAGGFTPVVRLPMGFFIFKINAIRQHGDLQMVKQYHVRHILIKVNEITSDQEAHNKILMIKGLLDKDKNNPKLLDQEFIKLAKHYSEDTSSINGGDLSWISRGDTVPAFEKAMLSTPVGEVSAPIRTPFGWHLLQVIAVRNSNLTSDREKAEIRQDLRDNKTSLIYAQWLRDIRAMSYVKMNDE